MALPSSVLCKFLDPKTPLLVIKRTIKKSLNKYQGSVIDKHLQQMMAFIILTTIQDTSKALERAVSNFPFFFLLFFLP